MYAGLAILFFFLVLFLQQIGGYTPLQSGLATLPATLVMFALSRRFGALADRFGPRFFMGAGPLVAAAGLLLFQRSASKVDYLSEVLPALLIFSLGSVDDRRAADGGGARGRGERPGGDRLGRSTTRSRASPACWARRRWARSSPRRSCSSTRQRPRRARRSAAPARAAVARSQAPAARAPRACRAAAAPGARDHASPPKRRRCTLPPGHDDRGAAGGGSAGSSAAVGIRNPRARGDPRRGLRGRSSWSAPRSTRRLARGRRRARRLGATAPAPARSRAARRSHAAQPGSPA